MNCFVERQKYMISPSKRPSHGEKLDMKHEITGNKKSTKCIPSTVISLAEMLLPVRDSSVN